MTLCLCVPIQHWLTACQERNRSYYTQKQKREVREKEIWKSKEEEMGAGGERNEKKGKEWSRRPVWNEQSDMSLLPLASLLNYGIVDSRKLKIQLLLK